jgi:hypothetical protein
MTRLALAFDPVLPWEIIAGLGALLSLVLLVLAWQRIRGTSLRLLASALLVLALTSPVLQREERESLPGVVALVVDESASQGLGNRGRKRTGTGGAAERAASGPWAALRCVRCAPRRGRRYGTACSRR